MAGCLAAIRGTKVVARLAEDTLQAVFNRAAADWCAAEALAALAGCLTTEAKAAAPQPAVVAAGLRVLAAAVGRLPGGAASASQKAAMAAAATLCEDVLGTRRLSPAFSQARAALQALAQHTGAQQEGASGD